MLPERIGSPDSARVEPGGVVRGGVVTVISVFLPDRCGPG